MKFKKIFFFLIQNIYESAAMLTKLYKNSFNTVLIRVEWTTRSWGL